MQIGPEHRTNDQRQQEQHIEYSLADHRIRSHNVPYLVKVVTRRLMLQHAQLTTCLLQLDSGEHRKVLNTAVGVVKSDFCLFAGLKKLGNKHLATAQRHGVKRHRDPVFRLHDVLPLSQHLRRLQPGGGGRSVTHSSLSRDEKPSQRLSSPKCRPCSRCRTLL